MQEGEEEYNLSRETQERAASDAAAYPAARRIHLYLADSYAERARKLRLDASLLGTCSSPAELVRCCHDRPLIACRPHSG